MDIFMDIILAHPQPSPEPGILMYITILMTQRMERRAVSCVASCRRAFRAQSASFCRSFGQLLAGVEISTRRNLRTGRFEEGPWSYLGQQRSPPRGEERLDL